ncbi:MAG: response regulator, partial [Pseudomonadota bacterium]|nr:response regulator [Pseudomonadota bacterium]
MRVLIVEDEQTLRESIVEQLQQHGFTVDAAADGEEGLYCGREYALDLAIIDLGLPKLPGLELIKTLRGEGKSFPILILTAR